MRVAFLGTAEFAVPALEALVKGGYELAGIVTGPDQPTGRGRKTLPTPVRSVAEGYGLPVLTPRKLKDSDFLAAFKDWEAEVAVVVAFRILPGEVYNSPPLGTINIHPSLLPAYRGPAPINWALINGEESTGVSIIRITNKVDAGGVLLQRSEDIKPDETAGELSQHLAVVGGELVLEVLKRLETGELKPVRQDEKLVSRAPKLSKSDGLLDWSLPARVLHNRVRGVTPWPGAYTYFEGQSLKLFRSRCCNGSGAAGEVLNIGEELIIACGQEALAFSEIQRQGKRRMTVAEFHCGFSMPARTVLGK